MDSGTCNSKKIKMHTNEEDGNMETSSTALKIQEIRQQLETLLSNAQGKNAGKNTRNPPQKEISISTINNQYCGRSLSISEANPLKNDPLRIKTSPKMKKINPNDQLCEKSLSISESSSRIANIDSFLNDSELIPADAKLAAYKKFIDSLTRIINDPCQASPDSVEVTIHAPKKSVEEKGTFVIHKDNYKLANTNASLKTNTKSREGLSKLKRAEKTTYCRPVAYNNDVANKSAERNAKLQLLVKKLVQAREKEKQAEAWNNYINELKNKHGYCGFQCGRTSPPKLNSREDERPDIINDSFNYSVKKSWKRPNLRDNLFDDLYGASSSIRPDNNSRRNIWYEPSASKPYKYTNNSFCLPMSSQARLTAMKRNKCWRHCSHRPIGRFFRGSSIVIEKQLSNGKRSPVKFRETSESPDPEPDVWECRAIQTGEYVYTCTKECQISETKSKLERITGYADQLRHKIKQSRSDNKKHSLLSIEHKLDDLIQSFNVFMTELKSRKVLSDVKSAGVSCSSLSKSDHIYKAKSDTYSLINKGRSIICEVAHPHSIVGFPPCPRNRHTIDEIMNEEKDKSDKVKKDIEKILNNNGQCAVKIMIDIPTREHSTEVTRSFYKTQQDETIVEEVEPIDRELTKNHDNITIAVNTDPLGLLALIRVSTETVKQILSYVPNLNYVTYLARRQITQASPIARYVCNICGSAFTRPSLLSDHIQEHDIPNTKNCCVCRHVLDRLSQRSGMFACCHCGQVFTRAYCRELHQQTCPMAKNRRDATPSLMLLS